MAKKLTNTKGNRDGSVKQAVVRKRDGKAAMSWAAIAAELGVSPRTVRRIYDEVKGEGAHFESRLEGKGGRTRQAEEANAE